VKRGEGKNQRTKSEIRKRNKCFRNRRAKGDKIPLSGAVGLGGSGGGWKDRKEKPTPRKKEKRSSLHASGRGKFFSENTRGGIKRRNRGLCLIHWVSQPRGKKIRGWSVDLVRGWGGGKPDFEKTRTISAMGNYIHGGVSQPGGLLRGEKETILVSKGPQRILKKRTKKT